MPVLPDGDVGQCFACFRIYFNKVGRLDIQKFQEETVRGLVAVDPSGEILAQIGLKRGGPKQFPGEGQTKNGLSFKIKQEGAIADLEQ